MGKSKKSGPDCGKRALNYRINIVVGMKKLCALVLTAGSVLSAFGQGKTISSDDEHAAVLIKKQIICHDLDGQVKDVQFATVRAFTRYKIAAWLWKDGKDDTGEAERFAVKAVEDLFENRSEIPDVYFNALKPDLFVLLDRHARKAADALRAKYKVEAESDLFDPLLDGKSGDKLAVDAAIKSLTNQAQTHPDIAALLARLQQRGSPEVLRLLEAIIHAEEAGRTRFSAETLLFIFSHFLESAVPVQIQRRFLGIVLAKSRTASVAPNGNIEGFFSLLSAILPTITTRFPELLSDASVVQTMLRARSSQELREAQERNDRIRNSPDKLSALLSEAERSDDRAVKYDLFVSAAQLALKDKKFNYAIDIVQKLAEIDLSSNAVSEEIRKAWRDQFRLQIVNAALTSDDSASASNAIKNIVDPLSRGDGFRRIASFYADKSESVSARDALGEAITSINKAEAGDQKISGVIKLLPITQKIDRNRVSELVELAAKAINSFPSINVEDKPQTENYRKYVTSIMHINWNLLPVLEKLLKENRGEAENLAGRIDRREVRIIVDYALRTDSINSRALVADQ